MTFIRVRRGSSFEMELNMVQKAIRNTGIFAAMAVLLFGIGCGKKKYENPITKDTQQPDKVLFDSAMNDVEHGRYERARLTLQTLMNTYDTSEYLAKAKLLVADSWFREGGTHGLAQAEAEYKDFILFYPQMEEAAEAQQKICDMQYQQMDKSDRDPTHAFRADDECRNVLTQFPNSKFAPAAAQKLRNIQEMLADREYKVGDFITRRAAFPLPPIACRGLRISTRSTAKRTMLVAGGRRLQAHGRQLRKPAGRSLYQDCQRLSAERARGRRQGPPERHEAAGAGGRPGGRNADEVRARKSREAQHVEQGMGTFQLAPQSERGGEIGHAADGTLSPTVPRAFRPRLRNGGG